MVKTIVVGLGVQGNKRANIIRKNLIATVDPYNTNADYKKINEVPINEYDAVFLCVPDKEKKKLIEFCIKHKKHVLVEKPLILGKKKILLIFKKRQQKIRY